MPKQGTGLSRAEKEEIIRWSLDKSEGITVFTHNEATVRKLKRAGAKVTEESKVGDRTVAWKMHMDHGPFVPKYPMRKRKASAKMLEALQKARSTSPEPVLAPSAPQTETQTTPDLPKS